jgi:germination protein M
MKKRLFSILLSAAIVFSLASCSLPSIFTEGETKTGGTAGTTTEATVKETASGTDALQQETVQTAAGKAVKVVLYFPTEDNSALKKEERELQVVNGAIIKATVEALLKGPVTAGLHNAIPEGTVLNGVNIKNKVAIVDFSKEFETPNDIAGAAERLSVVNTLTGINGVEKVRLRIDGKDMIGPDGKPLGDIGPERLDGSGAEGVR